MNTKNMNPPARATVAVAAAILTGSLAAVGASDPAAGTRELVERQALHEVVVRMPSGWPATDAMRDAADKPSGEPSERARWLRMAASMPSGWPATDAMRDAADKRSGEPSERARWLGMAASMPSGWPATVALAEAAT